MLFATPLKWTTAKISGRVRARGCIRLPFQTAKPPIPSAVWRWKREDDLRDLNQTIAVLAAIVLSFAAVPASAQDDPESACGPLYLQHRTITHREKPQPPALAADRALIYFIRGRSMRGALFQAK